MTDRFHAVPMATWARRYIDTFKLALVAIEPGEKAPKGLGWNKPGGYITDAQAAEAFWSANPTHNLGVVLGPMIEGALHVTKGITSAGAIIDAGGNSNHHTH